MSKRAGIYLRISDDREGRELGIARQEEDCRAYAKRHRFNVVSVYPENDRGASTRSKKKRPKYAAMLADIRAGQLDVVIAYSNSRLTRRPMEYEDLIQLAERTGVRYLTVVSGEDDLSTADGRYVARIKAAADAAESERTAERVERTSKQRAEQGRANGGRRPFGWSADDRRRLDPAEHAVILEMADRLLAGETAMGIARDFRARGVPTARGGRWDHLKIRRILTNPRLAGHRMYKGVRVATGDWEPAVDELTYRRLVRLLTDSGRRVTPGPGRKHLLSGIARCGECGAPMMSKTQKDAGRSERVRYRCVPCGLWRAKLPVELYVESGMIELLAQYQPLPDPGIDLAAQREADELRGKIDNAIERFAESDAVTGEQLEKLLRGLNRKLAAAEARAVPPTPVRILDGLTGQEPREAWESIGMDRQRAVIDALVTITLHRNRPGVRRFDPATVQIERR